MQMWKNYKMRIKMIMFQFNIYTKQNSNELLSSKKPGNRKKKD